MSTPEQTGDEELALPGLAERDLTDGDAAMQAALAFLPDAAAMSRLANEMFKAMPTAVAATSWAGASTLAPGVPLPDPFGVGSIPRVDTAALPSRGAPSTGSLELAATSAAAVSSSTSFYFLAHLAEQATSLAEAASIVHLPSALSTEPSIDVRGGSSDVAPFTFLPSLTPETRLRGDFFSPEAFRRDFPILNERVHGKKLVWLDNAATTQKPNAVIQRISRFYAEENSNIHRAAHALAGRATDAYEAARESVRRFLHASSTQEIIFVRGATEGINLVAQSWGRRFVGEGDEILISWLEHHSNIVPWQQLASEKRARLRVIPVDDRGQILLDEYERLLGPRTKIVSFTHVSNALGTVTPVQQMTEMAHRHGARVLVDGAQAVSHMPVDVRALGADWYVFSGHKVFGPTGIGVVYGRSDVLDAAPPWQGGGNMIRDVTFEKTVYQPAPMRFEAGTGNIADAVGLGAALDYLAGIGLENVSRHEQELLEYGTRKLMQVPGLRVIGTAAEKAGVISFVLHNFRSEEVGTALDREGIAVRAGHHCAQPALRRFGLETSVRPSFALYNTCADIDALVEVLHGLVDSRRGVGRQGAFGGSGIKQT